MKRFLFVHFLNMVREDHGADFVQDLVGVVNDQEGVRSGQVTAPAVFVRILGERTDTKSSVILREFGEYLFGILIRSYPSVTKGITHPLDFIIRVETFIHTRFKRQYPEADLPEFHSTRLSDDSLEMIYESAGQLENICDGIIRGVLNYYRRSAVITRESLSETEEKFLVKLAPQ